MADLIGKEIGKYQIIKRIGWPTLIFLLVGACTVNHPTTPLPTNTPLSTSQTTTDTPTMPVSDEVPMALIPAGEFLMGSESGGENERPVHKVYLDAYWIDIYEVTNAHYAACVADGACTTPSIKNSRTRIKYYGIHDFDNYPVIYVTWHQARAYCQWRGGDLPTEAQWEKAARGGLEGKTYPWGDTFEGDEANFCDVSCNQYMRDKTHDDGFADTAPVGSFGPNGYGLYDMAGNVWEWLLDWYESDFYSRSPYLNPVGPIGPDPSKYKLSLWRGGSWYYHVDTLRVAYRYTYPADRDSDFSDAGIRCVSIP